MMNTFIIVNITPKCINMCLPTPERASFFPQFGQKQNILGHSIERRAYWLVLKATRVFLIPTHGEETEDGEHFM